MFKKGTDEEDEFAVSLGMIIAIKKINKGLIQILMAF